MSSDQPAQPENENTFAKRLLRIGTGDIIRIVVISILVGIILAALNVNPRRLWVDLFGTIGEAWSRFISLLGDSVFWAIDYFLLGAVLVVPIWLVYRLLSSVGKR